MKIPSFPAFGTRIAAGVLAIILGGLAPLPAEPAPVAENLPVEPLTRYRLSFTAKDANDEGRWEVRIKTSDGQLPYEGVLAANWQKIQPGTHTYQHEFLTPRDGHSLNLLVESSGKAPRIEDVSLEKLPDGNPVINGDFSMGAENYSGWNTTWLARFQEGEDGGRILACEPDGYAISDPVVVEPGATYRLIEGTTPGGRILFYDRDLLSIGMVFERGFTPPKDAEFTVPEDVSFIRIEYCDGREHRVPGIRRAGIEKVSEGKTVAPRTFAPYPGEIVLSPNAALPEIRAARELQHWIRKISGKEIRVLAQPSKNDRPRIFVGRDWAEKHFPEDIKSLEGSDGFALRKNNGDVYVFGARPAGALFGAIRLLEDNSDLIFARPQKDYGTVFSANPDLRFDHADCLMRPAFVYRMSHGLAAETFDDGVWQGRAGLNTSPRLYNGFRRRELGGAPSFENNYMGTIARVPEFAFEKASVEHPEFFAFTNGERQIKPKGYICYTAPGVAEAIAEGLCRVVDEYKARGEPVEFLQIRTRDGWLVCACEKCLEPIQLPDGSLLKPKALTSNKDPLFFSTRMTQMLNRVGKEFSRIHPEITLSVPAYIYASTPPAIPHDASLAPVFCAYDLCSIRFPILDGKNNHFVDGRKWEEKFREYLKRTTGGHKLSMFSYHYANGFSAVADSAREDWLAIAKTGGAFQLHMDGFSRDAAGQNGVNSWDFDAPEKWIMSRLMWNPEQDAQELREEYCRRAYREAAPEMMEFYNAIRDAWKDPSIPLGVNCHTPGSVLFDTFIVKTGQEEKLRTLLDRAEAKAAHPHSKKLIHQVKAAFQRLADSLNRNYLPFVAESTKEWNLPESTFWLQALKFDDGFKKVPTWKDFKGAPADHPTTVSVMRDRENLYVRFDAENTGKEDLVEVLLEAKRHTVNYYFALDAEGGRASMQNSAQRESSDWESKVERTPHGYVAMFRIPFAVMENLDSKQPEFEFTAKFARIASGTDGMEESSLNGYSLTRTHFPNYWTKLSVRKEP